MKRDDLIFDIIEKEHQRQLKGIELIASENFVSDQVMEAMGSCLTNKYAEGYPGKRYYGGCEVVDQSEQIAIDRLKEIFGAEWANVQPHSGAQANAAVFLAVLNPGDKFMGLNLAHGGHLSHGSLVNTSGIIYTPCEYNLKQETGRVDYDQMEEVALREKPKMIIGNHALMCMRLTELIKSLFAYIVNNGVCLSCLSRDRSYRTILTAIQNKKLVYAFARTESFQHRITSFYLFTHILSSPIPARTSSMILLKSSFKYK